jgi:hypothetical protein
VAGDLLQNPPDLTVALQLQLAHLVVEIEHGGGLDVDRLPRAGDVVHEPFHLALSLGADGDDGAAVADCRLLLGRVALRRGLAERVEERAAEAALPLGERPANPP